MTKRDQTGEENFSSLLLMEYAPFGCLHDFLQSDVCTMDETLTRTMFNQILNGLEYLHNTAKVAHLDLKPDNLLIGEDFKLKICDFDLSYKLGSDKKTLSKGTKEYRAPELREQKFASKDGSPNKAFEHKKCDVFAAGIILFVIMN